MYKLRAILSYNNELGYRKTMKQKVTKLAVLSISALFVVVSCNVDDPEQGGIKVSNNSVTFIVGNDEVATKAGSVCLDEQVASYKFYEDGDDTELVMVETVSDMDASPCSSGPVTKGTPVYTENFDVIYGELFGTAFDGAITSGKLTDVVGSTLGDNGTVQFVKTASGTYSFNYKVQDINTYWPESKKMRYFLQAPECTKDLDPEFYGDGSIHFSYSDPNTPADDVITDGSLKQNDILFTSKLVEQPANPLEGVSAHILMYHALTAVKFKVGTPDQGNMPIITKVTIKDISSKGDCIITPNYTDANTSAGSNPSNHNSNVSSNETKSPRCTDWENLSASVDYVENFDGVITYAKGDGSNFAESFYAKAQDNNLGNKDGSKILLLIPQTKSNVEFEVEYKVTEGGDTYKRSAKADINWKAGEIHTYTFSINKVDVAVSDEVSGLVKSNVKTTNTGNVTAYLRAAYVLAWYYGDTVVAPYTGSTAVTLGDGWFKEGDYYYYTSPVAPGKDSKTPVFAGWTAPGTNTSGFPEAHLEMKILLQGVQYDTEKKNVNTAWGSTVADKLSTEIEK